MTRMLSLHTQYTFQLHLCNHISKIIEFYFAVDLPSSKFESTTDLLGPAVIPIILELPEKALMAECFKAIWADAAHCKTPSFTIHLRYIFLKRIPFHRTCEGLLFFSLLQLDRSPCRTFDCRCDHS